MTPSVQIRTGKNCSTIAISWILPLNKIMYAIFETIKEYDGIKTTLHPQHGVAVLTVYDPRLKAVEFAEEMAQGLEMACDRIKVKRLLDADAPEDNSCVEVAKFVDDPAEEDPIDKMVEDFIVNLFSHN